jgi:hypothetical protein
MFEQSTDAAPSDLRLFIGGIPLEWDEGHLHRFMQQFGVVEKVRINRDETSKPKGFGFATLSAHADPAFIYGKHPGLSHTIEIKELLQKCLYLLLPGPESLTIEQVRSHFEKLPYPLDTVEPIYTSGSQNCFVKVCFTRDHNLKAIIDKRFVDIDGVRVEVTDHLEKQAKQGKHSNQSKSANGKKKNHTHAANGRHEHGGFEPHREQARDPRLAAFQPADGSGSSSTFKSVIEATEDLHFPPGVSDSDFSSRSKRKLSFGKGKAIEGFVPQAYDKSLPFAMPHSTPDFSHKFGALPFNPVVQPNFPLHQMNVWHSSMLQSPNFASPLTAPLPAIPLHGYSSNAGWPAEVPITKKEPTINFFTFPGRD